MRLIFHGLLRKLYGEGITMNASSIADAIHGASTQLADWPRKLAISVVGYDTLDDLRESKPDEVHLMPALAGGSMKIVNFVIGAALIVAGILLLPVNPAIGISLIISGSMMVLQGIIMLFMKAPKTDTVQNPEDSKYLGLNKNTVASRTPMTLAWGKVKLFPHWLSLQSDSSLMSHGTFPTTPT